MSRKLIALAITAVAGVSGYFADRHMDTSWAQSKIQSQLQRDLRERSGDDSVTVQSVKCSVKHQRDTTCVAHVSDSTGTALDIHIAGNWNADTQTLTWHTIG
jgi:hypothetical protein